MNNCKAYVTNVWWDEKSTDKPSLEYLNDKFDDLSSNLEGWINFITPTSANFTYNYNKISELGNYLVIFGNDITQTPTYWFITNYRYLSNENIKCTLKLDIWTTHCAPFLTRDGLKNHGKIFLKRTTIERYKRNNNNKIVYNQNWGLFLAQDNLENSENYLGSEEFTFKTNPPLPLPWQFTNNNFSYHFDINGDQGRRVYLYALCTLSEKDLEGMQNDATFENNPPSSLVICEIPKWGDLGSLDQLHPTKNLHAEMNKYLSSPKLIGVFMSPIPFSAIPGNEFFGFSSETFTFPIDTEGKSDQKWNGFPINNFAWLKNEYIEENMPSDAQSFSTSINWYFENLEIYFILKDQLVSKFKSGINYLPSFKIDDRFNYLSEPKLYMNPYYNLNFQLGNDKTSFPYELTWLYNSSGRFKCNMYPSVEGLFYNFMITETDYQAIDKSAVMSFTLKDTLQIANTSNAYINYMQNHINSYNTSLGLSQMNQGTMLAEHSASNLITSGNVIPFSISSLLGTIGNLFTGSSSKSIAQLKAQVRDLKNVPETLKNHTNVEVFNVINSLKSNKYYYNKKTDPTTGSFFLHTINSFIKKPASAIQEKIAYHYHLNGYNVEGIPLDKTDIFTRSIFNYIMADNLRDIFDQDILGQQPWILDYLQQTLQEGVRIWNKLPENITELDYSVANWEKGLLS